VFYKFLVKSEELFRFRICFRFESGGFLFYDNKENKNEKMFVEMFVK